MILPTDMKLLSGLRDRLHQIQTCPHPYPLPSDGRGRTVGRLVVYPGFSSLALLAALLLLVPLLPLAAQNDDALPALVEVLGQTDDPQFQFDVLKGMSEGLRGRRGVKMPAGWEEVSAKLAKSTNSQVRELAQSLSLTFGSASALAAL